MKLKIIYGASLVILIAAMVFVKMKPEPTVKESHVIGIVKSVVSLEDESGKWSTMVLFRDAPILEFTSDKKPNLQRNRKVDLVFFEGKKELVRIIDLGEVEAEPNPAPWWNPD